MDHMKEISESTRLIKEGKIAFFVGAGISKDPPSNLLLGDELKNKTISALCSEFTGNERKEILESTKNLRPEVILQIIHNEIGNGALDILDVLKSDNPNQNHFFLAKAMNYGNTVITTNFDNLIECAYIREGFEPSVYFDDEGFEKWFENKKDNKKGGIFKIHGTLEEIHVTSEGIERKNRKDTIIATLNQVGKGLSKAKAKVLEHFFKKKDMVFIGYSGLDDFDIYPKMLQTESKKKIFWLDHVENAICEVISLHDIRKRRSDHIDKLLASGSSGVRIVCDARKIMEDLWKGAGFDNFPSFKENVIDYTPYFTEFAKDLSLYDKTSIIAHIFDYSDEWDKAIGKYNITCKELCSGNNGVVSQAKLIEVFSRLGLIHRYKEEHEKALDCYNQALKSIDLQPDPRKWNMKKAEILHQIGRIYHSNKDYTNAISCIKKAIPLRREIGDIQGVAYSCFQLLIIYLEKGETNVDFEGAKRSAENAIAFMKKSGDYRGIATMQHNLAFIQQTRAFIQQKNKKYVEAAKTYLKAIELYKEVLGKRTSLEAKREIGMTNARLGECYMGLVEIYHGLTEKAFNSAQLYSSEAKSIFEEIGDNIRLKQVSKTIEQIQNYKHLRGQNLNSSGILNSKAKYTKPMPAI